MGEDQSRLQKILKENEDKGYNFGKNKFQTNKEVAFSNNDPNMKDLKMTIAEESAKFECEHSNGSSEMVTGVV